MGVNTVEVDEGALAAEADRILSDVPAELTPQPGSEVGSEVGSLPTSEPTLEQIQAAAAGYEAGAFMIVSQAADVLVPAWEISGDERRALSSSMSLALAAWFPDHQLPPKYMALLAVAGSMYAIVDARRDPNTGKLKPRRNEKPDSAAAGSSAAPAAA